MHDGERVAGSASYPVRANLAASNLVHNNHLDGFELEDMTMGCYG